MKQTVRWIAAITLISGFALGCSSSRNASVSPGTVSDEARASTVTGADTMDASDSSDELESLYWARIDSSRSRFTKADVAFMTGMVTHHAQALVMSDLAPSHGAGPEVSTLTSRIMNAQRDEIATMQRWLKDRGQPVPEVTIEGLTMNISHVGPKMMHMPGMLSTEQLKELDAARGPQFDRLFLKYMIQHHRGAVTMVDELFATDGAGQDELAFKLASDINVDQKTEIARMELLLDRLSNQNQNR